MPIKKDMELKRNSSTRISLYYILASLITSIIISGCGDNKSTRDKSNQVSVEDMTGKSVMVPQSQDIKKIAVLTSPQVLDVYAIGLQDRLCGITDEVKNLELLNMFDPHLKKVSAVRTQEGQVNTQALLDADPDIVISSEDDMESIEKSSQVTTIRINSSRSQGSISRIRDEMRFVGRVFNKQEKAEQYVSYLDNILSLIKFTLADMPAENRVKVFMGFNAGHLATYGSDSFMDDWIKAAGCVNAAGSISGTGEKEGGLVTVSMEQVMSWDPDIVIIDNGDPDALLNDPSWSKLKAVQNKKVYRLPKGILDWNQVSLEGAAMVPQWLGVTAYPDKLNFLNMNDQASGFYTNIFALRFSDNLIHKILYPSQDQK